MVDALSASGEEDGGELAAFDPAHDGTSGDVEMLGDIGEAEPDLLRLGAGADGLLVVWAMAGRSRRVWSPTSVWGTSQVAGDGVAVWRLVGRMGWVLGRCGAGPVAMRGLLLTVPLTHGLGGWVKHERYPARARSSSRAAVTSRCLAIAA
jgi:hypothetical protein